MARLLFLTLLCALPSLVVPIHNSSAGGNLCVCVCLQYAIMDRSNSTEIAKWPEWNTAIYAVRKASVRQIIDHVAVIYLHHVETQSFVLHSVFSPRLRHHPASPGRRHPLQRPDPGAGTVLTAECGSSVTGSCCWIQDFQNKWHRSICPCQSMVCSAPPFYAGLKLNKAIKCSIINVTLNHLTTEILFIHLPFVWKLWGGGGKNRYMKLFHWKWAWINL